MKKWNTETEYLAYDKEHMVNCFRDREYDENNLKDAKLCWKLMNILESKFQELHDNYKIRELLGGHCANMKDEELASHYSLNPQTLAEEIASSWTLFYHEDLEKAKSVQDDELIQAVLNNTSTSGFKNLLRFGGLICHCFVCGKDVHWQTNGQDFRAYPADDRMSKCYGPCKETDAINPFITQLRVSSGKIVIKDDLREAYKEENEKDRYTRANINCNAGAIKESKYWATFNVVVGIIGNESPKIFKIINTEELIIGHAPWPQGTKFVEDQYGVHYDGYPIEDDEQLVNIGVKNVGNICTELWWYMIADYQDFIDRGGIIEDSYYGHTVLDVKNGVYEITHYETMPDRGKQWGTGGQIVAEIKWISD